jgi:hypothetical protein
MVFKIFHSCRIFRMLAFGKNRFAPLIVLTYRMGLHPYD